MVPHAEVDTSRSLVQPSKALAVDTVRPVDSIKRNLPTMTHAHKRPRPFAVNGMPYPPSQDKLTHYLATNVPGYPKGGCVKFELLQFSHGQSNPTYLVQVGQQRYVLRKKPPGKLLPSAHAVDREYEVLRALGTLRGTGRPAPLHDSSFFPYVFALFSETINPFAPRHPSGGSGPCGSFHVHRSQHTRHAILPHAVPPRPNLCRPQLPIPLTTSTPRSLLRHGPRPRRLALGPPSRRRPGWLWPPSALLRPAGQALGPPVPQPA